MLIFEKGLRIIFNDGLKRETGRINCRLAPVDENSCYLVNTYDECGELSDKSLIVLENQIQKVYIKDIDGFDVWVRLDDLYTSYPNGTIIRQDTKYKYNAERNALKASVNSAYWHYANYITNDEKAVKGAINFVWGYRIDTNPKKVIFNGPATIVIWHDGTKTIVKRREGEEDDREKAVMYCIIKKLCGNKAGMDRYLKQFKEDNKDEKKEN